MAHAVHRDFPEVISVLPSLSLEQRLNGLSTVISLGYKTILEESEALQDLPGEYLVRVYELQYEPGENSMRFSIPVKELEGIDGYCAGAICHLLAFRELHPELQLSTPIWAPGESFVRGGTQVIGLSEIRAAKDGVITSAERIEPAYGRLGRWNEQDGTKHAYFGLSGFSWVHNNAALYVKRI